jgi:pyruvate formate lyase activating enzyme
MSEKGIVFDIQRFSIHDGLGIRTLVFLKGCNLRCQWCSNPESQRFKPDLFFQPEKCIGCQACIKVCPQKAIIIKRGQIFFRRELCKNCGKCAEVCYAEARVIKGKEMSTDEVIKEVIKDKAFYSKTQGGITLGGGEPLQQSNFALSILKKCKEKRLSTAIETSGYVPWENIEKVILYTDFFLYDIKHMDPKVHKQYIGVDNQLILSYTVNSWF